MCSLVSIVESVVASFGRSIMEDVLSIIRCLEVQLVTLERERDRNLLEVIGAERRLERAVVQSVTVYPDRLFLIHL